MEMFAAQVRRPSADLPEGAVRATDERVIRRLVVLANRVVSGTGSGPVPRRRVGRPDHSAAVPTPAR